MSRVIIVDDRPYLLNEFIKEMHNDINFSTILYYKNNTNDSEDEIKEFFESQGLNGIEIKSVNSKNFDKVLDEYYAIDENIFFFDTYLQGEDINKAFSVQENIVYANNKKKKNPDNYRIYFYSSYKEVKSFLNQIFPQHVIRIDRYDVGQNMLFLNENEAKIAAEGRAIN